MSQRPSVKYIILHYDYFSDLEEFVDLKSVSNYGWRVDIERLKSKYFVDMMRAKDNLEMPNVNSKQNNIVGVKRREFLA